MSTPTPEDVALSDELAKLGPPVEDATPDEAPVTKKRRRSGTSGAERARRAKAAGETATAAPKPRAASSRTRKPAIAAGMAQLYTMAGMAVSAVPSGPAVAGPRAGASITSVVGLELVANAANIGAVWEKAAQEDARIRDALEKLLAVSTFGQIIAAHVPVILAGMVAAGAMPDLSQLATP